MFCAKWQTASLEKATDFINWTLLLAPFQIKIKSELLKSQYKMLLTD